MLILGIESTCDETACAVVRDGKEILSNVVASQVDLHKIYGGVVPELAARRHTEVIIPLLKQALDEAGVSFDEIDGIGVAHGPGLIGALQVGLNTAKGLSLGSGKPFIGVNHIEAHLYAAMMSYEKEVKFPALGVILSGGHTCLVLVEKIGKYRLIGQTIDDAIGEAFDKVARVLGLPYPGGPEIEALAKEGDASRFSFRAGRVKEKPYSFSLSGLKTAVLYAVKGNGNSVSGEDLIKEEERADVAAAFQTVVFDDVIKKSLNAADAFGCKDVVFGGGVIQNRFFQETFEKKKRELNLIWPAKELTLDNAAMIAGLAYHQFLERPEGDQLELAAQATIPFASS